MHLTKFGKLAPLEQNLAKRILCQNLPPCKPGSFCERGILRTDIQIANKDLTLKTWERVNLSLVVHCMQPVPQPVTEKYLHVRQELIVFLCTMFLGF